VSGAPDVESLVERLDALYVELLDSPTVVKAEGIAKLYRVVKTMADQLQDARAAAMYEYLAGTVAEWTANEPDEPPADLLDETGDGWYLWHNVARTMAMRPAGWTVRIGRNFYDCFSSASEAFSVASRGRLRRQNERRRQRAADARARGIPAPPDESV
jgi:hypothetical protein